jgi:hypothetical protein
MNLEPKKHVAEPKSETQSKLELETKKFMNLKATEIRFIGDHSYLLSTCPSRHFHARTCANTGFENSCKDCMTPKIVA